MQSKIALAIIIAGLSGCAQTSSVPFAEADFAPYAGKGPATLEAQAVLRTVGGDLKTCGGNEALLAPATAYDNGVVNSFIFRFEDAMRQAGPAAKYWRETACDAQGKFSFRNVPAGRWIVMTEVSWQVPVGLILGTGGPLGATPKMETQGGMLIAEIVLQPNDVGELVLTGRNMAKKGLEKLF